MDCQTFEAIAGGEGMEVFLKGAKSQDEGWLACGQSFGAMNLGDAWMAKFDEAGDLIWEYLHPLGGLETFWDVVELPSGEWVALGSSQPPGPVGVVSGKMFKLSPQGELMAEVTFSQEDAVNLRVLQRDFDGGFIALGWQATDDGGNEAVLYALDASFNVVEVVAWGEGNTRATAIVPDGNNGWFVAGNDPSMAGDNTDTWILYHLNSNFDVLGQIAHPISSVSALNGLDLVGSDLLLSGADRNENNEWRSGVARIPVDLSSVDWLSSDLASAHASGVYSPTATATGWSIGYGQNPQTGQYQPYMQAYSQDFEWASEVQWIPIDEQQAVVYDIVEHEGLLGLVGQAMLENQNAQGWLKVLDTPSYITERPSNTEWPAAYPNPTRGLVWLKCPSEGGLEWSDQQGKLVGEDVVPLGNGWFDLRRLPTGVYHVRLVTGQDQAPVQTVVFSAN